MNSGAGKAQPGERRFVLHNPGFCIVAARFNGQIVDQLIHGAVDALLRHDVPESAVDILRVPGAFELPLAVQRVAANRDYDAIIALAAIIRGDTPHFDYVSAECIRGLGRIALEYDVPVAMGVLTCDDIEQALLRSDDSPNNKGSEAALAAIEMVSVLRELDS